MPPMLYKVTCLLIKATVIFTAISGRLGNSAENNKSNTSHGDAVMGIAGKTRAQQELDLMGNLSLLHHNESFLMFWRPQKVGSSTILSLLVSYAYRYNVIIRRKAPMNSLCIKVAKCALQNNASLSSDQRHYLSKYTRRKVQGVGPPPGNPSMATQMEMTAENQRYMFSTGHQICYLPIQIVERELACSFLDRSKAVSLGNILQQQQTAPYHLSRERLKMKEIFIVRDPLSRAISVYYFWGELYKLARGSKLSIAEPNIHSHLPPNLPGSSLQTKLLAMAQMQHFLKSKSTPTKIQPASNTNGFAAAIRTWRNLTARDTLSSTADRKSRRSLVARKKRQRIGKNVQSGHVQGNLFTYHGNETTVPPHKLAMAYADKLPYTAGMPGPSYTWSAFADNQKEAVAVVSGDRLLTIVTERLDESLVAARHYLGWSLADMVVTVHRKALSRHPKAAAWPAEAVERMRAALERAGEYALYKAADRKLDQRLAALRSAGVDVEGEVARLRALRNRVTKICLSDAYLEKYRRHLFNEGFLQHIAENKLRDAEDIYTERGHFFSYNSELLFSFDVCGNCEAHALLLAVERNLATDIDTAPLLSELDRKLIENNPNFAKCPHLP